MIEWTEDHLLFAVLKYLGLPNLQREPYDRMSGQRSRADRFDFFGPSHGFLRVEPRGTQPEGLKIYFCEMIRQGEFSLNSRTHYEAWPGGGAPITVAVPTRLAPWLVVCMQGNRVLDFCVATAGVSSRCEDKVLKQFDIRGPHRKLLLVPGNVSQTPAGEDSAPGELAKYLERARELTTGAKSVIGLRRDTLDAHWDSYPLGIARLTMLVSCGLRTTGPPDLESFQNKRVDTLVEEHWPHYSNFVAQVEGGASDEERVWGFLRSTQVP